MIESALAEEIRSKESGGPPVFPDALIIAEIMEKNFPAIVPPQQLPCLDIGGVMRYSFIAKAVVYTPEKQGIKRSERIPVIADLLNGPDMTK